MDGKNAPGREANQQDINQSSSSRVMQEIEPALRELRLYCLSSFHDVTSTSSSRCDLPAAFLDLLATWRTLPSFFGPVVRPKQVFRDCVPDIFKFVLVFNPPLFLTVVGVDVDVESRTRI